MKKNYALFILPLFCVSALSGCNGGDSSSTSQTTKATITSHAEHATIDFEKNPTSYNVGDTVVFTVTPQENYVVDTVTANGTTLTETSGKYSFTALLENTIVVTDKHVFSTITVNGGEHCTIEFDKSKYEYHPGDEVSFSVTPNEEFYAVEKVEANGAELVDTLGMYSFVATKTNTITITEGYAAAVVTSSGEHATFTFDKENYKYNDIVKFNIAWDLNYEKVSVKVGENDVSYDEEAEFKYSFTATLSNHVVAVAQGVEVEVTKSADSEYVVFDMEKPSYRYGEEVRFNVSINGSDEIEIASVSANGTALSQEEGGYGYRFTAGLTNSINVTTQRKSIPVSSFNITAGNSTVSFEKERYQVGETAKFRVTPNNYYKVSKVVANGTEVSDSEGWYMLVVSLEGNSVVVTTDYDPVEPTIVVEGDITLINALENNEQQVTLPNVSAVDCYGSPLTPTITYKFNDEETTDPGYNSESIWAEGEYAIGKHEWTFTVTETHDTTKVASKTITLSVYKRIIGWYGDGYLKVENEASSNPIVTSTNTDNSISSFYIDASLNYYVEAHFNASVATGAGGFSHLASTSKTTAPADNNWMMDHLDISSKQHKIGRGWADTVGIWPSLEIASRGQGDNTSKINPTSLVGGYKYAVARVGNLFYSFINDQLLNVTTYPELKDVPTSPGLYFKNPNGSSIAASDFVFVLGEEATTNKVNSIVHATSMFLPARTDYESRTDMHSLGLYSAEKGNNFKWTTNNNMDFWGNAIRSKGLIRATGSTIDFDVQFLASVDWWSSEGFRFGTYFGSVNASQGTATTDTGYPKQGISIDYHNNEGVSSVKYGTSDQGSCNQFTSTFNNSDWDALFTNRTKLHIHIEITSTTWTYVFSDANDPSKSISGTVAYSYTDEGGYMNEIFTCDKASVEVTNYVIGVL